MPSSSASSSSLPLGSRPDSSWQPVRECSWRRRGPSSEHKASWSDARWRSPPGSCRWRRQEGEAFRTRSRYLRTTWLEGGERGRCRRRDARGHLLGDKRIEYEHGEDRRKKSRGWGQPLAGRQQHEAEAEQIRTPSERLTPGPCPHVEVEPPRPIPETHYCEGTRQETDRENPSGSTEMPRNVCDAMSEGTTATPSSRVHPDGQRS